MTEVTWIDDDGFLRIWHDDNYQMVTFTSASDVELKMDSWDMTLACNMIVFGDGMDNTLSIEYGLTECPHGTHGNDRAHHSITCINRFLTLAKSAIAIDRLKEHDRPVNWIKWAQSKGYDTNHLNPLVQIARLKIALQECPDNCPSVRDGYREQLEKWQAIADAPPQIEAVSDGGANSTEQISIRPIQANCNEFAFSGLLHKPSGPDDWFEVIDVMTKAFFNEHKTLPTKAQAWAILCENPPSGYGIKSNKNESLTMPGIIKSFNKRSFDRRWDKYTAKSNPFKPN